MTKRYKRCRYCVEAPGPDGRYCPEHARRRAERRAATFAQPTCRSCRNKVSLDNSNRGIMLCASCLHEAAARHVREEAQGAFEELRLVLEEMRSHRLRNGQPSARLTAWADRVEASVSTLESGR